MALRGPVGPCAVRLSEDAGPPNAKGLGSVGEPTLDVTHIWCQVTMKDARGPFIFAQAVVFCVVETRLPHSLPGRPFPASGMGENRAILLSFTECKNV